MKVIITIDPGVQGTGIAVWKASLWGIKRPPVRCFNYDRDQKLDWKETTREFVLRFDRLFRKYDVVDVYCEYPQYFGETGKGQASTGSGDIYKLSSLVGAFMAVTYLHQGTFTPIKVNSWKGQVPKEVIIRRITKLIPEMSNMEIVSHSWDAVGVGLYAQGILHPENLHLMNR